MTGEPISAFPDVGRHGWTRIGARRWRAGPPPLRRPGAAQTLLPQGMPRGPAPGWGRTEAAAQGTPMVSVGEESAMTLRSKG